MDPIYAIGLPPAQPLRPALVDPTDRYLRTWKPVPSCPQFDQQRVLPLLPPSFSLLLPLPTAVFTIMAKRKATRLRSWELGPKSTVIREERTERRTALETTGSTIRRLRGVKIRY